MNKRILMGNTQKSLIVWDIPILLLAILLASSLTLMRVVPQAPDTLSVARLAAPVVDVDSDSVVQGATPAEPGVDALAPPRGFSGDWWTQIQRDLRQSEYHVTWQDATYLTDVDAAFHAPNRAHNLRTYFTSEGAVTIPRVWSEGEESPPWRWGLTLTGYGYAGDIQPIASAELTASANRVEYRRGTVTEWYVNDERGLEQGFILAAPPPSTIQNPPSAIVLELALVGNLVPHLTGDGAAIEFTTSSSARAEEASGPRVLRYSDLHVTDASGRQLAAHLSLAKQTHGPRGTQYGIRITVDDTHAVYPITVDPLTTSPAWTAESDQAGAYFGFSAGTAGDVNGDGFADVVVGAHKYDGGQTNEGRAFVFHGSAMGLSTTPDWTAESDQTNAQFGSTAGTAGDVNGDGFADVIVAASAYDNGQTNEGRAFVYYGSAAGLSTTADWMAESDQAGARFGTSVGTAGDVNGDSYADVIVGANNYDSGGPGQAYVYHGSATGLSTSADWNVVGDQNGDSFGRSVGTAGDVNGDGYADVIVGAEWYRNGQWGEGGVFVYHGSAAGLSTTADWTAESNQSGASFGMSVGTAGDVNGDGYADVVVGARYYDHGESNEGGAFLYHGSATGLSTSPNWTAEGNQAGADFGWSVGTAGDLNGDSYADVIVGAKQYDNGESDEGRVYIYHGSAAGLSTTADWTAESDQAGAQFGVSAGTAGDVNGDGYLDVIIGAHGYDNGETDEGRAFVYYGESGNQPPTADAGGPYSGDEGSAIALSGATASDPDDDSLTFAWSMNSTLCIFSNPSVLNPTLTCTDNGSYVVTLTVDDGVNDPVSSDATVTVSNVAPTATFTNTLGIVFEGESATLSFSDQFDPSAADTAAGFLYSYDCTDDGTFELEGDSTPTFNCPYPSAGTFTARGIIQDKDGGFTEYTVAVTVLTPRGAIKTVIDDVKNLVNTGALSKYQGKALIRKLRNATIALHKGKITKAVCELQKFIARVNRLIDRGFLSPEQGQPLIDTVNRIIASIS